MKHLKIRSITLLLAFLSVGFTYSAIAQGDKKSTAILDAMSSKYQKMKSFKANFTYTPEGGKPLKGDVTVKGAKYRLSIAGQEIYNDGKLMATYIKETNEVNLQDYDPAEAGELDPTKIYTAYKNGYRHAFIKEQKSGSRTLELIQLTSTSKNSQVAKVELLIDKVDKTIKNWKIFQKNGSQVNYTVDQFKPNLTVADSYFTFNSKQYPGVEVVDLR
ncbi:outer membrane lipoprotein-sorting protein [Dyadobacter jejuensis]|uniref:Outer membrane lipoprotein-sorting protein n=1 Tax=Dyadobacter jejuensis TaxID=1082580 RepID=A0A316A7F0_9BACT|nr:outer membrane lipoprotein carrier protein LolA [Dyadobacter jejuensis]PWJ53379.1 outer membrane lipoprotein-sorting protein [Dyadobacter jejuensis]